MRVHIIQQLTLLVALAMSLWGSGNAAAFSGPLPLEQVSVPEALKGWEAWALHGTESRRCPQDPNSGAVCEWISELSVDANDKGAHFSMRVDAFSTVQTVLPRAKGAWPVSVLVDQKPVPVVASYSGKPTVWLAPGTHHIEGKLQWEQMPPALEIEPKSGVISVKIRGEKLSFFEVDQGGTISLLAQDNASEDDEDDEEFQSRVNALELSVHRKLTDQIPAILDTQLNVSIGGAQREEILGPVLPEGFIPVSVSSDTLSVRMDEKGRLKIIAKPGRHTIDVRGRLEDGRQTKFSMPVTESQWVEEETWSFEPDGALRQVSISGANAVDPKMTPMPASWHHLAAYGLSKDNSLLLRETSRGMAPETQSGSKPTIDRTLWLDFDGKNFSVFDQIQGQMKRSQRLNAQSPLHLGRVYQQRNNSLLITHSPTSQLPGVELPSGRVDLKSEGRLDRDGSLIPWGWVQEFQSAKVSLNLPPGWRLFSASGLEGGTHNPTWLASWDLWSLFLLMLAAAVAGQLYGLPWGAFTLLTMTLLIPENRSCAYVGIVLMGLNALWKFMHKTRLKKFIGVLRWGGRIAFLAVGLSVLIHQMSIGLHPILEHDVGSSSSLLPDVRNLMATSSNALSGDAVVAEDIMEDEEAVAPRAMAAKSRMKPMPSMRMSSSDSKAVPPPPRASASVQGAYRLDASAAAQMGWGVPSWTWNTYRFSLNEHIPSGASLSFKLIPPWLHRAMSILRALLILLVMGLFFEVKDRFLKRGSPKPSNAENSGATSSASASTDFPKTPVTIVLLALCLSAFALGQPATAFAADQVVGAMPSDGQLSELRERLLAKPKCFPRCASIQSMKVATDAIKATLSVDVELHAASYSVVALPGLENWAYPSTASLEKNASEGATLVRGTTGALYAFVPKGIHHLTLQGPMPSSSSFHLTVPLFPQSIRLRAPGFDVAGIDASGKLSGTSLVFTRKPQVEKALGGMVGDTPMEDVGEVLEDSTWKKARAPYFLVTRTLRLGMTWQVFTEVELVDEGTSSEATFIPLLAGEKVMDEGLQVEGNRVRVALSHATPSASWTSTLDNASVLNLTAPKDAPIFEHWVVSTDPIWHVQFGGSAPQLSVVSKPFFGQMWDFRPLPGETLTMQIQRPRPLDGQRTLIESSQLIFFPGQKDLKATLDLNVSTSVGVDFPIQLPPGSTLTKVTLGAKELELPLDQDGKLTAHFAPGKNKLSVEWIMEGGNQFFWKLPEVKLPMASANATTVLSPTSSRWILLTGGTPMGPVVRFWSLFVALILVAFALSKISHSQPVFIDWLLFLVGLGIMDSGIPTMIIGGAWFLFMGWRAKTPNLKPWIFNLRQIFAAGALLVFLGLLVSVAKDGILSTPNMMIDGYKSWEAKLQWFVDRTDGTLSGPWVISAPLVLYKVMMLSWALWLAFALVRWIKWGFGAFSTGGMWKVSGVPQVKQEEKTPMAEAENKTAEPSVEADKKAEEVVASGVTEKPDEKAT